MCLPILRLSFVLLYLVFAAACAHGGESREETSLTTGQTAGSGLQRERVERAIDGCDVAFFEPYMTPNARAAFVETMRLGWSMLDGLETLQVKVKDRYGIDPIVEGDGDVIFPGAVNMGGERADARINLGFSPVMECTVLGIYGENVLSRAPSGPCDAVTLEHSQIRIVGAEDGCLIDLNGTVEEAQPALRILGLFVAFVDQQNRILERSQVPSYIDWGGQFMGSFKATVQEIKATQVPGAAHP